MQKAFDELYQQSKNGNNFYKLLEIIGSEQNICLAYRNLKTNSGSKTAGTDGKTIEDIKGLSGREVIETVRKQLADYHPQSVRRVFIPKPGSDKKRPLGIPCIWDRLIQQCILQVLEPICEPKFHNHSYGFRQNRDAHHAVSRVVSMVNMYKHYYCVDVDIKGFFDNVNHGKLLKQIWTLGIRDKRLLCIISKILKSEIEGEGIPDKGTPQGGLISPLLSLIVLNELDWWVSSQWETFTPKISMQAMYTRAKLKAEDIRQFMYQFGNVLKETGKYLLDIHCILLEPEYIFYEEGQFFFCYYPPATQDLWEKFHVLTEYMVKVADYEEEECVRLAFLLHKGTMEENYSLEKLIAECGEREEKDMEKPVRKTMIDELLEEKRERTSYYDTEEHDWITEQEMGSSIMRETDNLWIPVKRFLNKHKKTKWGEWDGLHIEEEEL